MLLSGCEIGTESLPADPSRPTADAQMSDVPAGVESSRAARGHLKFVDGFARGCAVASRDGKPALVFFTAEWCHYCHQMADEAFTNPQVVRLADQFVCVLVDADREPQVCRQFKVTGYPTIQFLSPQGVPLERIVGKKPGHQVMMAMHAALQHVARRDTASGNTILR
jgi:thioredoxin-like negative regulator of GroEL